MPFFNINIGNIHVLTIYNKIIFNYFLTKNETEIQEWGLYKKYIWQGDGSCVKYR